MPHECRNVNCCWLFQITSLGSRERFEGLLQCPGALSEQPVCRCFGPAETLVRKPLLIWLLTPCYKSDFLHYSDSSSPGSRRACTTRWVTAASWSCRLPWPLNQRTWMLPWHRWENPCRRAKGFRHFQQRGGGVLILMSCGVTFVVCSLM